MTRKEFANYLKEYKLRTQANNIERLLAMAKYHADLADKTCDSIMKKLDDFHQENG